MNIITPKGIKDYQTCALLYKYRHKDELPEKINGRDLVSEKFENTIKQIVFYFFYKKQKDGLTPSYDSLLNRWQKIWFAEDVSDYDIITEQHETAYGNTASLTTRAAALFRSFHKNYSDQEYIPISINDSVIVPIDKVINLKYNFDLILYKNKKYYVIKFLFNYKNNHHYMYETDFSAMKYAFSKRNPDRLKDTKFGYIDFAQPNVIFQPCTINNEDLSALEFWSKEASQEEIFAPRRGLTWYCKKCPFDKPCSKWKGWKDVEKA